MANELDIGGRHLISSKAAGERFGITHDYISRLCREGKVSGQLFGRTWYVDPENLALFLDVKEVEKRRQARELSKERAHEYRETANMPAQKTLVLPLVHSAPSVQPITPVRQSLQDLFPDKQARAQAGAAGPAQNSKRRAPAHALPIFAGIMIGSIFFAASAYALVESPAFKSVAHAMAHEANRAVAAVGSALANVTGSQVAAVNDATAPLPENAGTATTQTNVNPNITIASTLVPRPDFAQGSLVVGVPIAITKTLEVDGAATFKSTLSVAALSVGSVRTNVLTVAGASNLAGNVNAGGNVAVAGNLAANGGITTGGATVDLQGGKIFASNVVNDITAGTNVTITGTPNHPVINVQNSSPVIFGGGGGISKITTGQGLTGGPLTGAGTIALDLTSANIWTGLQTFSGGASTSVLTLATALAPQYGGTGTSTIPSYGQLLIGDGNGGYNLISTSSLGVSAPAYFAVNASTTYLNSSGNLGIGTSTSYSQITSWGSGNLFAAVNSASSTIFSIGQNGATTTNLAATGSTTLAALTLSSIAACGTSNALQTNASGNVFCGPIASLGLSTAGGWATDNKGDVTLATSTDRVGIGATTTPYAALSVISSSAATTTLALVAHAGQTANLIDIYGTGGFTDVLSSNGSLGLGTTSPSHTLEVAGSTFLDGDLTASGTVAFTGGATTTSNNGFDISAGCFSIGGSCITASSLGGLTSVATNYPLFGNGTSGSPLSIAFGTTTANSWSQLQTFDDTKATNATVTNLTIASASSTLLKANSFGAVVAAVPGVDYEAPDWNLFDNALAPTTTLGVLVSASSTIGSGTQAGGLTINGGATTTGAALFTGAVSITGSATTTANNGFNISNGCFSINGACLSAAGLGGLSSVTADYPLLGAGTSASHLSLAFGTTTANTWSQLQVFGNTTATNATTTNLGITGVASSILKTTALGTVVPAVAGVDYATPGSVSSVQNWKIAFNALTPTTTLGILVNSSSTIGNGTQAGGLTINGGATTTGNATFSGTVAFNGATTTGANGVDIASGCFSINGSCLSATGLGGLSSVTADYPLLGAGTSASHLSLAFGTTTNNTWSGTNTFTNTATFTSTLALSNILTCAGSNALQTDASGHVSCGAIASLGVSTAGGWTTDNVGQVTLATTSNQVAIGATTTPYAKLVISSGSAATTTLALLPASGQTANILDIYNTSGSLSSVFTASGNLGIGTTSPTNKLEVAGNTFLGGNLTATGTVSFTGGATTTSNNGFNITAGCFSLNGTCLSAAGLGGLTSVAADYPLLGNGTSGSPLNLAFGTTTANAWNQLQTFSSGFIANASSTVIGGFTTSGTATSTNLAITGVTGSLLKTNSLGQVSAAAAGTDYLAPNSLSGTFPITYNNGTGAIGFNGLSTSTAAVIGAIPYFSGANTFANVATTSATLGLGLSGSLTTLGAAQSLSVATSSFFTGTTGQLAYFNGVNALSGTSSLFIASSGNVGIGTTTPGSPLSLGGIANFTSATSSFYGTGGINIANGCFSINGTCLSASSLGASTFAFPWTPTTNFGAAANATSTPIWFQSGLQSSSTIQTTGINIWPATSTVLSYQGQPLLIASTTNNSMFLGVGAGTANTGFENTGSGFSALSSNTTGNANTAYGMQALVSNTTGSSNVAVGFNALESNAAATNDVAVGFQAARFFGTQNHGSTYIGYQSGYFGNTGSDYNTLLGYQSGYSVSTGYGNTLVGTNDTTNNSITTGHGNVGLGYNTFFPSATANNQLNIGNVLFGTLPATSTAFQLPTSGSIGIGTSTPWAKLSVQANNGDTATTLFAIASSTANSTTTLFSVSNTGSTTIANGVNITGGCFSMNGTCLSAAGLGGLTSVSATYPLQGNGTSGSPLNLAFGTTTANSWSQLQLFNGGLAAYASSTIGNGTQTGGLTINGGATTTFDMSVNGLTVGRGGGNLSSNTAIGVSALGSVSNSFAQENTSIGYESLLSNTFGADNTAIGFETLHNNLTGSNNNAIGFNALYHNLTGNSNVANGADALVNNTSATSSTALGYFAGAGSAQYHNQGGTYVGYQSGYSAGTGSDYNTLLGYQSGYDITTGTHNLVLGDWTSTGVGITTGSNNILIGQGAVAGIAQTGSNQLDIGNLIFGTGITSSSTVSNGSIGIGTTTPGSLFSIGNTNGINFSTGTSTFSTTGGINIANGCFSINGTCLSAGSLGASTFAFPWTTTTNFGQTVNATSTPIWFQSGLQSSSTIQTTGINIWPATSTVLSYQGQPLLIASSTNDSIFLGFEAGASIQTGGIGNFGVGYQALQANTTGSGNTVIGDQAGYSNVNGTDNTFLGSLAGYSNTNGTSNIAIGNRAATGNTSGSNNIALGRNAAFLNTTGSNSIALGYQAGYNNTTGYSNLFLGDNTQTTGGITTGYGNVLIGPNVFPASATVNHQLNIGNILFGTLPATTTAFQLPTSGSIGIGTSTPWAKLSIAANNGDTNTTLFAIASSTVSATTTLFSVSNTGSTTIANGVNITGGCFSINGTCLSAGGLGGLTSVSATYPLQGNGTSGSPLNLAFGTTTVNTWNALQTFTGGVALGNATSTGFAITDATSTLLKTDANGNVIPAIAGTDYATPGSVGGSISAAFPFTTTTNFGQTVNATNTPIWLQAGLQASSTSQLASANVWGTLNFATTSTSTLATVGGSSFITASSTLYNTGIGFDALNPSTTGSYNTANGWGALGVNTTGHNNTAIGLDALSANTTGYLNTAVGNALTMMQSGWANVGIGELAGQGLSTSSQNVLVGYEAGSGAGYPFTATGNTVVGPLAGESFATGANYNTLLGLRAGDTISTGYENILIGSAISCCLQMNISSGAGNIGIGNELFFASSTANNQLNIGNLLYGTIPATTTAFQLPTAGSIGIGTTSPYAKFAIASNNGDTATTLFAIASSTASATTTLFSVSNTGTTTAVNGFNISNGCFSINGSCLSAAGLGGLTSVTADYPLLGAGTSASHLSLAFGTTTANSWSQLQTFGSTIATNATTTNLGITSVASSILKTTALGTVVPAVAGTDYQLPGFNNWVIANGALSPTTTIGVLVNASSTFGNGAQGGGLTIAGNATTTGSLTLSGASSTLSFGSSFGTGDTSFGLRDNGGVIEFKNAYASTTALGAGWTPLSAIPAVRYNLTESGWADTGAALPSGIRGGSLVAVGDYLYLFGGTAASTGATIYRAPIDNPTSWSNTGATLPANRDEMESVVIGDYIYLFGGYTGASSVSTIYRAPVSSPTSWVDTGKTLPSTLADAPIAVIGNYIYTFGGYLSGSSDTNAIYRASVSDPTTWTNTGATIPVAMRGGDIAVIGDYVYLFGGFTTSGTMYNTIYRAPVSNPLSWSNTGKTLPAVRALAAFDIIGDYAYIFGGYTGSAASASIWRAPISDPTNWSDTGLTLPVAVRNTNNQTAVIGDHAYIFAGYTTGPSAEIYSAPITSNANLNPNWTERVNSTVAPWAVSSGSAYYMGGNVGIGTTSPFAALSVAGAGFFNGNLTGANITATGTLAITGTTGTTTIAAGQGFTIGGSQFVLQQGSGNVGIGTTSPFTTLGVAGSAFIGGNLTATGTVSFTGSATTTAANGINISAGCFSIGGTCLSAAGLGGLTSVAANYPLLGNGTSGSPLSLAFGTTTANAWSQLQTFSSGFLSLASSTIGNGTAAGGLTIAGNATTTGSLTLSGASSTLSFGSSFGTGDTSFGLRDNGGVIEFKNAYASTTALGAGWTPLSAIPAVRYNLTESGWAATSGTLPAGINSGNLAVIGDYIYMFGGSNNGSGAVNTIYRAPIDNPTSWSNTGATLPANLNAAESLVVGDYVYLFGGYNGSGAENTIYRAPVSNPTQWVNTGKVLPQLLADSNIAVIGNYIYIFGGYVGGSSDTNVIYRASVSDPTTWTNTGATIPTAMRGANVAVIGDYVYLFGGFTTSGTMYNTIYSAPVSNPLSWSNTGATLPATRADGALDIIGDYVYYFGGYTGSASAATTWRAPLSNPTSWSDTGNALPIGVHATMYQSAVIGDRLYIFGGYTTTATSAIYSTPITSNMSLNPNWTERANVESPWFTSSPSSSAVSYLAGSVGIGTTTPYWTLQVASSTGPQLALSDGSATSNPFTFRSINGNLYIATSSPSTFATSTYTALTINQNGNLGIGTTTPGSLLSLGGIANFTAATSSFYGTGGINIASGCFSINGTCLSASSLGASTFAFPWTTTTNFGQTVNATSTPIWFQNGLQASSTSQLASANVWGTLNFATTSGPLSTLATLRGQSLLVVSNAGTGIGVGVLSSDAGFGNTGTGYNALSANTTGSDNVANGGYALGGNTTGGGNDAIGYGALQSNSTGSSNNALGLSALNSNTTGSNNTAMGEYAGYNNTTGYSNLFLGDNTQTTGGITTGFGNILIGSNVFPASQTGNHQLNIGNILFGSLPATSTAFQLPTSGSIGIGTSTPWAKLSIAANNGDTNTTLFAIASSTVSATTTLFDVQNNGFVGIGTTSPFANLAVQGSGFTTGQTTFAVYGNASNNVAGGIILQGGVGDGHGGTVTIAGGANDLSGGFGGDVDIAGGDASRTSSAGGNVFIDGGTNGLYPSFAGTSVGSVLLNTKNTMSNVGIGTSTPFATLSIAANNGGIARTLFAIASSTASATTTLFSVSNTGSTTIANGVNITSGCFSINGTCLSASSLGASTFAFPWTATTFGSTAANATSTLIGFNAGLYSLASSTIGNGTQAGGLTISGGATTTGSAYVAGNVNIGGTSAYSINGQQIAIASTTHSDYFFGNAGNSTMTGSANNGSGYQSLYSNTTGSNNTANGSQALYNNTSGSYNIANGSLALWNNISGSNNLANGYGALYTSTGSNNIGIGDHSFVNQTTGSYNTAVGSQVAYGAGSYSSQGSTYIGYKSGYGVSNGSDYNAFLGYSSGLNDSTGADNAFFGGNAGSNVTTGNNDIALGFGTYFASTTANNQLNIGNLLYGTLPATTTAFQLPTSGSIGIGTSTPWAKLSIAANNGDTNATLFAIASSTSNSTTTLFSINNVGQLALNTNAATSTLATFGGRSLIVASTSPSLTSGGNTGFGLDTLSAITGGHANTGFGYQALLSNSAGSDNTVFGYKTGVSITTGSNNAIFGANTDTAANTSQAVLIGSGIGGSGYDLTDSTAVGYNSLPATSPALENAVFGSQAFGGTGGGNENVVVGYKALNQIWSTATANTLVGSQAGYKLGYTNGTTVFSTFLGYHAGINVDTGYGNILIGASSSANLISGSNNIALGNNTYFPSASTNNTLNIGGLLFGSLPATTTAFQLPTSGSIGIGTSTPWAKFAIAANNGDTNTTLFAIASSTASATTTLFSVNNTGSTTIANGVNITSGCFAVNGTCISTGGSSGAAFAWTPTTFGSTAANATSTLIGLNSGFYSLASSTIGNGTQAGGLTISGGATTTGNVYVAGNVNIGGASAYSINGQSVVTASTTLSNYFFGDAGNLTMTGSNNTGTGYQALSSNTSGSDDTANGYQALFFNTSGSSNAAYGSFALYNNTTANDNSAFGHEALYANTTGHDNTATGYLALTSNTTGYQNTAVGSNALNRLTNGTQNIALGYNALPYVTFGSSNIGIGNNANDTTSGYSNVAIGGGAMGNNFGGGNSGNTSVGDATLNMLSGNFNTALGYQAAASHGVITGNYNLILGATAQPAKLTGSGQLNIGNLLFGTGLDQAAYAGGIASSTFGIGTTTPWARFSIQANNGDTNTTLFAIASSTASATTTFLTVSNAGLLSVGANSANTFTTDPITGSTTIANLSLGNLTFDTDAGVVNLSDIPVDSNAAAGVPQSQSIALGGNPLLTVYGQSTGAGSVQNTSVGIGTTTPWAQLSVLASPTASSTSNTVFAIASSTAAYATSTLFVVNNSGNVGIGTSSPSTALQVAGSIAPNAGSTYNLGTATYNFGCLYYNGGTLGTCASDQRLKTDITDLNFDMSTSSAFQQVMALQPHSFAYKTASTTIYHGLIAQEVASTSPELVATDASTSLMSVKYGDVQWLILQGLQEVGAQIQGMLGVGVAGTTAQQALATAAFQDLTTNLTKWFANASNGIGDFFANRVHTKELCVAKSDGTEVCVTGDQLAAALTGAGSASSTAVTASTTASTSSLQAAPTISVNGNNPATVAIGTTYNDLGAVITGPTADLNLGISASVDGGATTTLDKIVIDTSKVGTHTILYSATDQNGITGSASRSVVVYDPNATSTAATSSAATSTPQSGSDTQASVPTIAASTSATSTQATSVNTASSSPAISTSTAPIVSTATSTPTTSTGAEAPVTNTSTSTPATSTASSTPATQ